MYLKILVYYNIIVVYIKCRNRKISMIKYMYVDNNVLINYK